MTYWAETHKGDKDCRLLADCHYSRQTPGHPMFCRPGYNLVLKAPRAVWVWFRPKWESGIKGTERKDKLRAIECTLFRNESPILSSVLILEATLLWLPRWERAQDTDWPDGAITGIKSSATAARRSRKSPPGKCYLAAGWEQFEHRASDRADVWLRFRREWL